MKSSVMKKSSNLTIVILFVIGILVASGTYYLMNNQSKETLLPSPQESSIISIDENIDTDEYLNDPNNISSPDFVAAKESIEIGDIKNAPALWEKVVQNDIDAGKYKNTSEFKGKVNSKIILAQARLQQGNYYYKEQEAADKTIQMLTENEDEDYGAHGMYFVGYAYEITKRYSDALTWYEKGLKVSTNDNKLNSIFNNQIGHVYDLQGDMTKAYEYYLKAYNLNKKNFHAATNIGRYLLRINKPKESLPYFEYALFTPDKALRSEIYYTLSAIELDINGLKPDIDKSIEYARSSIKSFPDYPMGYVGLAKALYMKNDKKYDKEIEDNLMKSMELNPNGFAAYKYYALHMFDKGDINGASLLMAKSNELVDKDIILMQNVLETEKMINTMFIRTMIILDKINKEGENKELVGKLIANDHFKGFVDLQKKRINNGVFHAFFK